VSYGTQDFVLEEGVRWDMIFEVLDFDDSAFDITGFTPRMRAYRDTQLTLSTEGTAPAILLDYQPDGDVNIFALTIMGNITASLFQPIGSAGNLNYYLDLVDALNPDSVVRFLKGTFIVDREGPQP
jgi:hypothetical protein